MTGTHPCGSWTPMAMEAQMPRVSKGTSVLGPSKQNPSPGWRPQQTSIPSKFRRPKCKFKV